MVKGVVEQLSKQKDHCNSIILRIVNSRGVCSHDFLISMFLFAIGNAFPKIDLTEVETHEILYKYCSDLLTDMKNEGMLGQSDIDSPLVLFEDNRNCYHLTWSGAWKAWQAIKSNPDDTLVQYIFACQIETSMEDIYFIDKELYCTTNLIHGPFFNFDDPSNPASQEELYDY